MSAAWLLGGAWGVARPATEVGGAAALVSPETAGPGPFARFADELAHGNLARSIYTCEVPSFETTCTSIAGVQVDEATCAGRAFQSGIEVKKPTCSKSDQEKGKCRKVARPLSEKRMKTKRRIKKPAG